MAKCPDYLWLTVFGEQGDMAGCVAALLGAVDGATYSSSFARIKHAKTFKRFGEPMSWDVWAGEPAIVAGIPPVPIGNLMRLARGSESGEFFCSMVELCRLI